MVGGDTLTDAQATFQNNEPGQLQV